MLKRLETSRRKKRDKNLAFVHTWIFFFLSRRLFSYDPIERLGFKVHQHLIEILIRSCTLFRCLRELSASSWSLFHFNSLNSYWSCASLRFSRWIPTHIHITPDFKGKWMQRQVLYSLHHHRAPHGTGSSPAQLRKFENILWIPMVGKINKVK